MYILLNRSREGERDKAHEATTHSTHPTVRSDGCDEKKISQAKFKFTLYSQCS